MIDESHLAALSRIVGERNVLRPDDGLADYERGARKDVGRAAFVVRPKSTEEVSGVVGYCISHVIQFVPQSGNTGLVGASTPDSSGLQGVLSLERLNQISDINPRNRTVELGAGVRLSALNRALEEHGQFFPIDLGADPMVGGMIATNTGGARYIKYGDVRRNLIGLEVVLPDKAGTVLDLMSNCRKDNTGPDLKQLFVGTSGAFGIVTRAVLETHYRPAQSAAAIVVPRDDGAVLAILEAIERAAPEKLAAFELMSREAMKAAFAHVASLRNPFGSGQIPPSALLVEFAQGSAQTGEISVEEQLQLLLSEIMERPGSPILDAIFGSATQFWALRHALSEGISATGRLVSFDLGFSRTALATFREETRNWLAFNHPGIRVCDFGHVGDGGLHFNLVLPEGGHAYDDAGIQSLRLEIVTRAVKGYGASFSAEHSLGRYNRSYYEKFKSSTSRGMTDAIHAAICTNGGFPAWMA